MAKILVIDDDPMIVELLKESLISQGHSVVTGYDGQSAVHLARQAKPSLAILDVDMPLTNGIHALQSIRRIRETQDLPVIFLTGALASVIYPAVQSTHRATYLKKPVDLEDLNSMVRDFLGRYPRQTLGAASAQKQRLQRL